MARRSAAVATVSGVPVLGLLPEADFDTGGLLKFTACVTLDGYKRCGEDDDIKSS